MFMALWMIFSFTVLSLFWLSDSPTLSRCGLVAGACLLMSFGMINQHAPPIQREPRAPFALLELLFGI